MLNRYSWRRGNPMSTQTLTLSVSTPGRGSVRFRFLYFALCAALWTAGTALAQSAGAGMIAGRVFNAATNSYVRNAEVRVEGTSVIAYTEDAGSYRLVGVPAGEVTLTVTYT